MMITSRWLSLLLLLLLGMLFSHGAHADERVFESNSRLLLGNETSRSASVRVADLDGDGDKDVAVANGRHWPQQNFVFLNQGRARFNVQRNLGADRCTTYATELADLDGDGDLDVAVGNDMAPNRIFLNDGRGQFESAGTFGQPSSLRSLTTVDIDKDGDVDILATSRRRANMIYFNDGNGRFGAGQTFGTRNDSTIDVATVDWNRDGHLDLVLANRGQEKNAILLNDGNAKFTGSGRPNWPLRCPRIRRRPHHHQVNYAQSAAAYVSVGL